MPDERRRWERETLRPALDKVPERQSHFTFTSGEEVSPLYSSADLAGIDPEAVTGFPGEYPFGRGIQPTMYRGRLWTMRQYAGFASAAESNQRYRYLLPSTCPLRSATIPTIRSPVERSARWACR